MKDYSDEFFIRSDEDLEMVKATALSGSALSAGWVSELSEKELRMLKKGLKQLNYTGLGSMTIQIGLERKLVKELSRRKKPNDNHHPERG